VNGAHALLRTLVASGVDTCFANPGTSEMHFVAALDDVEGMRAVLGLFEGVATGAADGFARIARRPAATLLHLGPGMANGMANLHNARRARVPMVNIVGDHATYHVGFDTALTSDIRTVAQTFSGWTGCPTRPEDIGTAAAEAVAQARSVPSSISTLILPADVSWGEGGEPAVARAPVEAGRVESATVDRIAAVLRSGERCLLLLGGAATDAASCAAAQRVAAATGAELLVETLTTRLERGGGIAPIARLSYRARAAVRQLEGVRHLILADAKPPVAAFAYPDRPSELTPDGCEVHELADATVDAADALAQLADRLGAAPLPPGEEVRAELPTGELSGAAVAAAVGALLPEDAIVVDESGAAGFHVPGATARGPRHSWLQVMGGAIGMGLPVAVGAAVAAPHRKVVGLQADGSAMYTIQALWTHARENLDTTTIILNNGQYEVLHHELRLVGATAGPKALELLDIGRPDLDFVKLSTGLGVAAERATTAEEFTAALSRGLAEPGPYLIEAMLTS
jgi:acetolactate synthase-1/2/3 large subunit